MKGQPTLTVTSDFTADFNRIVKSFKQDAVLVGIPAEDTDREGNAHITNAALLAMNEFGSPANNIPARPVMKIGIKNAQDAIAEQFAKAAREAFTKGAGALELYYNRAGFIAANSVKKVINDQEGIAPPSDNTIAIRRAGGFKKWAKSGADLGSFNLSSKQVKAAGGFLGTKALVVTGQMRNAITYVVKSVWGA